MAKQDKQRALLLETERPVPTREAKKKKWLSAEVIKRKEFTKTLLLLTVRPTQPFPFQPGQYVKLGLAGVKRRYSLVSAPHEEVLEFCIERVPGGEMTTRLWTLQRGDVIAIQAKTKGKLS